MRADLHVHSHHSGYTPNLSFFRSLDCYSTPEEVYRRAKARGMDLVTITDHDSIDGCLEFLDRHPDAPDFIIGEEVECRLADEGLIVHVGVLGLDERIHREMQPLRDDVFALAAFLRSERLPFALNHPFMFYEESADFLRYVHDLVAMFPGIESRNGAMLEEHNRLAESIGESHRRRGLPMARFAGSDAHTLTTVGSTYTEVEAATAEEFLWKLRAGESRVGGRHGSTAALATEIYGVVFDYWSSLLGARPQPVAFADRMRGIALSLLSLPFQFIPAVIAARKKSHEAKLIERLAARWLEVEQAHRPEGIERDAETELVT